MDDFLIKKIGAQIIAACDSRGLNGGGALVRYVEHGIMPGDFLTAVLENKLTEAACRADSDNLPRLHMWADIVYNYVPVGARGDHVESWSRIGGLNGVMLQKQQEAEMKLAMRRS